MTVLADLHTHSTASDGQYRPAELVRMARDRGIEVLALTDHDTLAGLDEAVLAGKELGGPGFAGRRAERPGAAHLPHPKLWL
ncbi:MAG: PHP domain-containing protein [Oscillospiraceae bacterium]|nr:PHP domain-containing protein [Oscillospiraceae bacterium]